MEFVEALQEFLFHQGFQRIKYDSKILWGKDANGKLSMLEIVPPVLPGQKKISLEQREREMADIERQIMIKYQKKVEHLLLILKQGEPDTEERKEAESYPDVWFFDIKAGQLYIYEYQKSEYYLVYQPVGIKDWSIVGIVEKSVVDSSMRMVQGTTIILLCMMATCIMIGVVILMKQRAKAQLQKEADERIKAEKKREISDQLFWGISQIVDCFAICDLKNNRYEYEDKRGKYLYPKKGSYDQFIKEISDQYTILTDGENAKFTNMLSIEHVRQLIKEQKDSYCLEYCARDKSRFYIMNVIPVEWEEDTLTKIMLVSQDMGQQHELENLANTDALTGLFNKRYFEKMMEIRDEKKKPYALFYMDLDLFKPVNDTYGHEMGDKVLKEVAKRLLMCIRSNDYAFRIGGDEFMLILKGKLDAQICEKRIERIKKLIGEPYELDGYTIKIGISCGSAVYPDDAGCAADIQKLADKRMYEDKKINHAQR